MESTTETSNIKKEVENKEEEEDVIDKLLSEEIQASIFDYFINTLFVNGTAFTQGLDKKDYDIVLSSLEAEGQEIFHSLNICNCKFDPKSKASKKVIHYEDLQKIMTNFLKWKNEKEEEFKKHPNKKEFAVINMHAYPMIRKNLQFDITTIPFKEIKKNKDSMNQLFDYKIEKFPPDDKKDYIFFCSFKLNGKPHKFEKIQQLLTQFTEFKDFWNFYKKAFFIFCVEQGTNILTEYNLFPNWLKEANEKNDHAKFLFYIDPPGEDPEQVMNIFKMNEFEKDYYFMMNKDYYVYKADSMLCSGDIVENSIERKKKGNLNIKEEDMKKALSEFYDFVDNIKKYRYNFFFGYQLEVCLKYDGEKIFISYVNFSHLIAEVRTNEYLLLKKCADIFKPDLVELTEIKTKDLSIDFKVNKCKVCQRDIKNEEDMYYCYECREKYCSKCVLENFNNKKGLEKFIDPKHNLIYFKTRNLEQFKNIEIFKLGKNSFTKCKDESHLGSHSMSCNGCGSLKDYVKPRYLCLSCGPGMLQDDGFADYCLECIEHMNKNDQKGKEIQKTEYDLFNQETRFFYDDQTKVKHDHNNHIYLMIALEYKEDKTKSAYYDF